MDSFLARLERRFGNLAIENIGTFIAGGMGIVFVLSMLRPEFAAALTLDIGLVKQGQVWRLVTYLFLPDTKSIFWIIFSLYWVWMIASNLESEWGAFKLNIFYLLGMIGTTVAAVIAGRSSGNLFLNLSLFLAFATLFPNYEIFLLFVLKVKIKWLGILSAVFAGVQFITGDWATRAAIVAAMANYLLFFGPQLVGLGRARNQSVRQSAGRVSTSPPPEAVGTMAARVCALCGKGEDDDADIRVCTCAKCLALGGPRNLCLEHARSH